MCSCTIFAFEGQNAEKKDFSLKCSWLAFSIVALVPVISLELFVSRAYVASYPSYGASYPSIDLAVDYIMKGNPDNKLGRGNLTKLFFFATAQTHFFFLGNFYDQIDGVAMGSPLAYQNVKEEFVPF